MKINKHIYGKLPIVPLISFVIANINNLEILKSANLKYNTP